MEVNPTPEILTQVHASSPPYLVRRQGKTGEFVSQVVWDMETEDRNLFYDTNIHPKLEKVEIVEGTDIYNELMEKYGCLSWYDWKCQKLGN